MPRAWCLVLNLRRRNGRETPPQSPCPNGCGDGWQRLNRGAPTKHPGQPLTATRRPGPYAPHQARCRGSTPTSCLIDPCTRVASPADSHGTTRFKARLATNRRPPRDGPQAFSTPRHAADPQLDPALGRATPVFSWGKWSGPPITPAGDNDDLRGECEGLTRLHTQASPKGSFLGPPVDHDARALHPGSGSASSFPRPTLVDDKFPATHQRA